MRLPALSELATSRDMIDAFGGYNHNLRIGENEFYDMRNLSSSHYPLLAPREQRGTAFTAEENDKIVGLIEKDALCYVKEHLGKLYFVMNGYSYELGMVATENEGKERNLISMGAYVVIMPDKYYINTKNPDEKDVNDNLIGRGNIEAVYETSVTGQDDDGNDIYESVTFEICRMDGTSYENIFKSPDEPTEENLSEQGKKLTNGFLWLDTSVTPNSLKIYSESTGTWTSVATTYIKIKAAGIGRGFNQYDGVKISGVTVPTENDLNSTMVIYAKDNDSITVVGLLKGDISFEQTDKITVERSMPEMDFIVESNNRLWGCRYGTNSEGNVVNELYASKLGDFKNWNCFMGISTDSYYVSLGTDGQFTGAFSYLGQPIFFKENCLHLVYGSYPAEYQVQDIACRGVQRNSDKSLAMVNEALYYKSRTGICAYSGSLPTEISTVLGDKSYSNAVACSHKGKYYISMRDLSVKDEEEYVLFVADTEKGMWHKEDNLRVKRFCPVDDEIYFVDTDDGAVRSLFGSGTKDTAPIKWMAETGILGCSSPDKKYISRLSVRLSMDIGARVSFSIQYDSSGEWEYVCALQGHNLRTMTLPIRPKRCDHFRLRIEGEGKAKIFSITKITEQGSDI